MLKDQFIVRTILTVLLGVFFVYCAIRYAGNRPTYSAVKRGKFQIALSVLSVVVSGIYVVLSVTAYHCIDFSSQSISMYYPTPPTDWWSIFFNCLSCAITSFAIACYLFFYKRSNTKIWAKVLKVFNFALAYVTLAYIDSASIFSFPLMALNVWGVKKCGYYE